MKQKYVCIIECVTSVVYVHLRILHTFPTRRSSDLNHVDESGLAGAIGTQQPEELARLDRQAHARERAHGAEALLELPDLDRSEEHTSELQSPDHLVCRLLLEKKKNNSLIINSSMVH